MAYDCRVIHPPLPSTDAVKLASAACGVYFEDIQQAALRIKTHARVTPVLTSRLVNAALSSDGAHFFFKCDNFQNTGSFKFRGACNAVAAAKEHDLSRTVVTHSSGNHAQAVAAAARLFGLRAHVVMPTDTTPPKVRAVKAYGAEITFCERSSQSRVAVAERVRHAVDGVLVHPFEDPHVVAGHGTIGIELLQQVPDMEALVVPIGGGALISGIAIAVKTKNPSVVLVGAEPRLACSAAQSVCAGEHIKGDGISNTVADGLKTGIGVLAWQVVSTLVDKVITVEECEIISSTRLIWERMKLIIEPSSGVAVAAAASDEFRRLGFKRVAVLLCGGNIDLDFLPWQGK